MVRTKNPTVRAGERVPKDVQQEDPLDSLFADDDDGGSPELPLKEDNFSRNSEIPAPSKIGVKRKLKITLPTESNVANPMRGLVDETTDEEISPPPTKPEKFQQVYQRLRKKVSQVSDKPLVQSETNDMVDVSLEKIANVSTEKGKKKLGESTSQGEQRSSKRMTRSHAADALANLSKNLPKRRKKEGAVKESLKLKASVQSVDKLLQKSSLAKGSTSSKKGISKPLESKDEDVKTRWTIILNRSFTREHDLKPPSVQDFHILELLEEVGLTKTAVRVQSFVKKIVLEFYANLTTEMGDVTSKNAFLASVRGHLFAFSPHEINNYLKFIPSKEPTVPIDLNVVAKELSGGIVSTWVSKRGLKASALTHKYSILHKIGMRNWVPTSNHSKVSTELADLLYKVGTKSPFNFGQIIFDHICSHAGSSAGKKPIGFPSLIFGILQSQHNLVTTDDVFECPAPDIVITTKLQNIDYHINDIQIISDDDEQGGLPSLSSNSPAKVLSDVTPNIFVSDSKQMLSILQAESTFLSTSIKEQSQMFLLLKQAILRNKSRKKEVDNLLATFSADPKISKQNSTVFEKGEPSGTKNADRSTEETLQVDSNGDDDGGAVLKKTDASGAKHSNTSDTETEDEEEYLDESETEASVDNDGSIPSDADKTSGED